jgi:dTDP-4-dehydrorhamnose 3,5-epimerase
MIFKETKLGGSYIISLDKIEDERGFFARSFCVSEFQDRGLNATIKQCNISFNKKKYTLRGMHFQIKPYEETKIVRCTSGAIYDVIIDLRKDSATYKQYFAIELNSNNRDMLYIPEGIAHGFITLADNTEVVYQMSGYYSPEHASGVRWDDSAFEIKWPCMPKVISDKDSNYTNWE